MSYSIFPAPSTGPSIPEGLRPPTFSYSQQWSLQGLSNISSAIGNGLALTYRPTDNSLYVVVNGSSTIYTLNLTNNTTAGSKTFPNSITGLKDIVSAADGTLYAAEVTPAGAAVDMNFSTNGGTSWTSMGSTLQSTRGFLTVIDNGVIPGVTGNIVWSNNGGATVGTSVDRVYINNALTTTFLETQEDSVDINGGRYYFQLKDGDDVAGNGKIAQISNSGGGSFAMGTATGQQSVFRYATLGTSKASTTFTVRLSCNLPNWNLNSSNVNQFTVGRFAMAKPTTIQSRWIVGGTGQAVADGCFLTVADYENAFNRVGTFPLRIDEFTATTRSRDFSNPVYVSATKKLYVAAINANNARIYEYNVTTY